MMLKNPRQWAPLFLASVALLFGLSILLNVVFSFSLEIGLAIVLLAVAIIAR
jgi:hypothetical protein